MQDFIKVKSDMEANLKENMETIQMLKDENKKNEYELEKQNLIEKKKLHKEMFEYLDIMAKEFRNAFHQQIRYLKIFLQENRVEIKLIVNNLSETTRKIIRENYVLNSKIKKITDTTNVLLNENEKLKEIVSNFYKNLSYNHILF